MNDFIAELEIKRIPWHILRESSGFANQIPIALFDMLNSSTADQTQEAYWRLENHVVVQGQLFQVAEAVTSVLISSLLNKRGNHVKIGVLELLLQIVLAVPHQEEIKLGNFELSEKCKSKAREGIWLLYDELIAGEKAGAYEILEVIEGDKSKLDYFSDNYLKESQ
jgi:hypothetical protein